MKNTEFNKMPKKHIVKLWLNSICIFAKNKFSGKAMTISEDMILFANEAVKRIEHFNDLLAKGTYKLGKPIFSREVDGGKYGKGIVQVVLYDIPIGTKSSMAWAIKETGTIGIDINKTIGKDEMSVILHELIHLFDPKLNIAKLRDTSWGINNYSKDGKSLGPSEDQIKNKEYHTNPWEQDAYMQQNARGIVSHLEWLFDYDYPKIQSYLSELKPKSEMEKAWYENKKIWRKYINTIYQKLIEEKAKYEEQHKKISNWINSNIKFAQNINPSKLMNIDVEFIDSFDQGENVYAELYKSINTDEGVIRIIDKDVGQYLRMQKYPLFSSAEKEYNIAKNRYIRGEEMTKEQMQSWVKKNCKFAISIFNTGSPEDMSNSELSDALITKYDDEALVDELLNRIPHNEYAHSTMSKEEYYSFMQNNDKDAFWDKARAMTTQDLINLYNKVGSIHASKLIIDLLAQRLPSDIPEDSNIPDRNDYDDRDIGYHPDY